MSVEVINLFTSSKNIEFLKEEISKKIKDDRIREAIIDTIIEDIFNYQNYALIEDSGQYLRHSTNTKTEVERLNVGFIDDRVSFSKNFDLYASAQEYYADQMFIDDSLRPGPYDHLNDPECGCIDECNCKTRMFRYQDPNDLNRSSIPVWQQLSRGFTDYNNTDELRNSEISQIRKATDVVIINHIETLPLECKRPQWIDI